MKFKKVESLRRKTQVICSSLNRLGIPAFLSNQRPDIIFSTERLHNLLHEFDLLTPYKNIKFVKLNTIGYTPEEDIEGLYFDPLTYHILVGVGEDHPMKSLQGNVYLEPLTNIRQLIKRRIIKSVDHDEMMKEIWKLALFLKKYNYIDLGLRKYVEGERKWKKI